MMHSYIGSYDNSKELANRTGIDYSDEGHNKIVSKGAFQDVFDALLEHLDVASSSNELYGEEIQDTECLLVIYQFVGYQWAIVESPSFQPIKSWPILKSHIAQKISKSLLTDSIFYNHQPYEVRFDNYRAGEIVEKFLSFPKGELKRKVKAKEIDPKKLYWFSETENYLYFYPDLTHKEIKEAISNCKYKTSFRICEYLLSKYSLYIPSILWQPNLTSNHTTFSIENLDKSSFSGFGSISLKSPLL